jgi:hypothetical protein
MQFHDFTIVSKGTHALIFQAKQVGEEPQLYCIKLFRKGWMTPFNLELQAYERLLELDGIQRYIPKVFGYGQRTLSEWGFDRSPTDEDIYYAIVMEWIENAEQISAANVTVGNACKLLAGLSKIHQAGVLHNDVFRRNTMVIPGTNKAIWLDFSCAHLNEEAYLAQELEAAAGMILWRVCLRYFISNLEAV